MTRLDPQLENRLRNVPPPLGGDWADVVSRAHARTRARRRRLVVALAALVFVLAAGTAIGVVGTQVLGWFSVEESPEEIPAGAVSGVDYVFGDVLYAAGRPPQRLGMPLRASLLGTQATVVVPSPDGRYVAYHAWRGRTPLLRVHDTENGRDRLLERGAQTIAWGRDGRIAYFRASRARYEGRGAYLGHIVVRRSLAEAAVAWTPRAGAYGAVAWAAGRLLVTVRPCYFPACRNDPDAGVYTLDDRGRLLPLRIANVAALSPDGRHAVGEFERFAGQDSPSPLVRLVDVRTARALHTFDVERALRAAGIRGRAFVGSIQQADWRADEIVASGLLGSSGALLFLRVDGARLALVDVLRIPPAALANTYGINFGTPSFVGPSTRRVVVQISGERRDGTYTTALLTCDRETRRCVRGREHSGRRWFAVVANPSRP